MSLFTRAASRRRTQPNVAAVRRTVAAVLLAVAAVAATLAIRPGAANAYVGAPWFEPDEPYTENFPDPSIVVDRPARTYYAYATSTGGAYLPVLRSTDLRRWVARERYPQPACVEGRADPYFNDALPCPAPWAPDRPGAVGRLRKEIWAPGVARIGGHWVAFYAVRVRVDIDRFCISVATSSSPTGPFVDRSQGPLVCDPDPNGSIDPQPFVDDDGTPYLVWKSEGVPGHMPTRIWVRRLQPSGTAFADAGPTELLRTSQAWEGHVVENPSLVRAGGRVYLFYSGNEHRSAAYATGYATCAGPVGPCVKYGANPVLGSRGERLGPAGGTAFVDLGGQLQLGYHWWNAPFTSYPSDPGCDGSDPRTGVPTCRSQGQRRLSVEPVHLLAAGPHVGHLVGARGTSRACPPGSFAVGTFGDVSDRSPHAGAIDCTTSRWGVAGGARPGVYAPAAPVSRGQMARMLANVIRTSGGTLPAASKDHFRDDEASVFEDDIDRLAEAGIVGGFPDGTYRPGEGVNRAQMATFLVRAYERRAGAVLAPGLDYFYDDERSPHQANIEMAARAGFTSGRAPGWFSPGGWVRRDQMASFVARTVDLLVEIGKASPPR